MRRARVDATHWTGPFFAHPQASRVADALRNEQFCRAAAMLKTFVKTYVGARRLQLLQRRPTRCAEGRAVQGPGARPAARCRGERGGVRAARDGQQAAVWCRGVRLAAGCGWLCPRFPSGAHALCAHARLPRPAPTPHTPAVPSRPAPGRAATWTAATDPCTARASCRPLSPTFCHVPRAPSSADDGQRCADRQRLRAPEEPVCAAAPVEGRPAACYELPENRRHEGARRRAPRLAAACLSPLFACGAPSKV